MPWHARLDLHHQRRGPCTVARFVHDGPLRVLQSLYPEGDGICHNVLVHPPGGLVGGDTLDISLRVDPGAHGLVTTPGATRFYRSSDAPALQRTRVSVAPGGRLEWLPLEAIAYDACQARNELRMDLAPGAELMGWDITALGLPHAGQAFTCGELTQHLELEGAWLERGRIAADDHRLLDGPLGLAGHRCMASLFFACGSEMTRARREQALDVAREALEALPRPSPAGVTAPHGRIVVLRVLAAQVEPAMTLLRTVRARWREALWQLPATAPRIWAM